MAVDLTAMPADPPEEKKPSSAEGLVPRTSIDAIADTLRAVIQVQYYQTVIISQVALTVQTLVQHIVDGESLDKDGARKTLEKAGRALKDLNDYVRDWNEGHGES